MSDKYLGKTLGGRYEVREVIGTGGMAIVYKAYCTVLHRFVAIKVLKDEFASDEEFRKRFYNEAQAVAKLSHSNIVSIYDVSQGESGAEYIVMELCEGVTLKDYLRKKHHLSWQETVYFAQQVARALDHAHSRGIIHQDIKHGKGDGLRYRQFCQQSGNAQGIRGNRLGTLHFAGAGEGHQGGLPH